MKIDARVCELLPANPWKIASRKGPGNPRTVIVELTDANGATGLGEAAPAALYGESVETFLKALPQVNASRLSFQDVPGGMAYLGRISGLPQAVKCAINLGLLDGAAKLAAQPLHDYLGLGFRERHHVTSFSLGIDSPEMIQKKALDAAPFPILKLKVGDPRDRENFAALREVAPLKPVRLDANEAWHTKEEALRTIEWLATACGNIQYIEQPMPRQTSESDWKWLKTRSPLPIYGDESCHTVKDVPRCAECFHGVNVKLVKAGGVSMARETLEAARKAGLKTMIGCMIETNIEISAAAHLAELADYLDLDGNLLITNDLYEGVTAENGVLSFASATEKHGIRATLKNRSPASAD